MRINVYSQELTSECEMVSKTGTNEIGETETFYGARFYLHSPEMLHHSPDDDDRSAVTIWLPKSDDRKARLAEMLWNLGDMVKDKIKP